MSKIARVKFIRDKEPNIKALTASSKVLDGALYVATDTGTLWMGTSATSLIQIKDNINTNTTYTLTKSGNTITLKGSDGSSVNVTDSNTIYSNATASAAGLMSAADKSKLDSVATGANKTVVDTSFVADSTNPVQSKVVKSALDGKSDTGHKHVKADITDFPTSMPASDVSAWAKAATKPTYTKAEIGLGNVDNTADSAKSVKYASSAGSASTAVSATKATQDSAGQQINTTYIKNLSAQGHIITYTRGDNTTDTITTQNIVHLPSSENKYKNKWVKLATVDLSSSDSWVACSGTLSFTQGEGGSALGILKFSFRNGETAGVVTSGSLVWVSLSSNQYSESVAAVKASNAKLDIYYKPTNDWETPYIALLDCTNDSAFTFNSGDYVDSISAFATSIAASYASYVSWGNVAGKPSFATVATSGSYNDLSNKPTIPTVPDSLKNPNALTISLNGTSQGAYDGSAVKNINITASSVGAAASSHTHTKAQITDFPTSMPASDVYSWAKQSSKPSYTISEVSGNLPASRISGVIDAANLPSYVDDVIEGYLNGGKFYTTKSSSGAYSGEIKAEAGKIYVDLSNNKTYRWSGSTYVVISETIALGTTHATAGYGDESRAAYNHSTSTGNPHNTTKADLGLGNVENKSSATIRSELTSANVTTALGYTPPKTDTNTHYTTRIVAGAVNGTANAVTTNGNTHINVTDDNTFSSGVAIKGTGATSVTSDASGNITVSSTDTWRPIQNNLTSTATDESLSAAQGKALNDKFSSYVPTSRTVNGKALSANITLSAGDVGAAPASHTHDDRYYTESEIDTKLNAKAASDIVTISSTQPTSDTCKIWIKI